MPACGLLSMAQTFLDRLSLEDRGIFRYQHFNGELRSLGLCDRCILAWAVTRAVLMNGDTLVYVHVGSMRW